MSAGAKPNRSATRHEGDHHVNRCALDVEEESQKNDLRHSGASSRIDELRKEREEKQCHLRIEYVNHDALSKNDSKRRSRQTRDIDYRPRSQQKSQAKDEQINRSSHADDVVSEGYGSEECGEAERNRCYVE